MTLRATNCYPRLLSNMYGVFRNKYQDSVYTDPEDGSYSLYWWMCFQGMLRGMDIPASMVILCNVAFAWWLAFSIKRHPNVTIAEDTGDVSMTQD